MVIIYSPWHQKCYIYIYRFEEVLFLLITVVTSTASLCSVEGCTIEDHCDLVLCDSSFHPCFSFYQSNYQVLK